MPSPAHGNFQPSSRGALRVRFFIGQQARTKAYEYTKDGHIGVSMEAKQVYVQVGFDLWRSNSDLTKRTQDLLMEGWNRYVAHLKKRTPQMRAQAAATTFEAVIRREHIEDWKEKLRAILDRPCALERHDRPFIQERRIGAKG